MASAVSPSSHLLHIHPYPYTPAFEAVHSALWTVNDPEEEVKIHRKLVLNVLKAAQSYLLHILEGFDKHDALRDFRDAAIKVVQDQRDTDVRERDDRVARLASLTPNMLYAERAKWVLDGIVPLPDPAPRPDVPTLLEEAVQRVADRRVRAGNHHEAPVYRFATSVVRAIAGYVHVTTDWRRILWQLSVYAYPKRAREPAPVAQAVMDMRDGVRGAVSGLAKDVRRQLGPATKLYVEYRDCKVRNARVGITL
ncbi:hypothetical protein A1Q2_07071 [Trichosporon asahii var. asahii CBS 8904]|uniref:Uncharacterized protein n=1 Tax=Trichosporon asahii var. asahii (strain CBS 8904) TaxID=1220162 RepID=K1V3Y2_TRIAC|nr:hypothetical protein A1Q2_07071 [Trichosporon asahii var. asahii CBS 8904]